MILLSLLLTLVHSKRISPASDGYHVKHDVSRNQFSWFVLGDWGGRFVPGVDKNIILINLFLFEFNLAEVEKQFTSFHFRLLQKKGTISYGFLGLVKV